jgi:hypothetical protein
MVSGAGDWPAKALSPALGFCVAIVPATEAFARLTAKYSTHKAHTDLPPVLESARVHYQ